MNLSYLHLIWIVPLLYALFKVLRVLIQPFIPSPLHKIPGPKSTSWFNGNTPEIIKEQAMSPHMRWIKEYPDSPLIHYRMYANQERVLFVDPEAANMVLNEKELLSKKLMNYKALSKFIGNGLVTLLGNEHKEQRKLIQPAFHFHNLKGMVETFVQQTKILIDIWKQKENGSSVEIAEDFSKLTLNIIGLTAFGFNFSSLSEENNIGKEATKRFTNIIAGKRGALANMLLFVFPISSSVPFGVFRELKEDMKYTDDLVKTLIKSKRLLIQEQKDNNEEIEDNNLLDILLRSQDASAMSDYQLVDHVKTLLFAGHETTATLTTWCLYALSQEPEITAKLKKELDEKLDESNITYENLEQLVYLKAVIKETLRMYPPVAIVVRRLEKDIEVKGYKIPAGTPCTICPYVLHHNPNLWEDVETFNPERWLGKDTIPRGQFLPFLKGPRNCIGEKFAMMEAQTILALVLKNFKFSMDKTKWAETERTLRVTMRPKPALVLNIHHYE